MKQRLIKVIVSVCLAVSVFLCSGDVALAREVTDEDFTGSVQVIGGTWINLTDAHVGNMQTGSSSVYGVLSGSSTYCIRVSGMEVGRTYSGYALISLTLNSRYATFPDGVTPFMYSVSVSPVTVMDGISLGTSGFDTSGTDSTKGYFYLYFNNWYNDVGDTLNFSFSLDVQHIFYSNNGSVPSFEYMEGNSGVDWAGTLYQRLPENGSQLELDAIQQQTDKQQQIAQQQQQQSAQQHEDLKSGFQDDTYNSNVSAAGSQVDSYISQESALMNQQQNQVADYAANNFNTGLINTYMPAIAAVSGWYTILWNSFGDLNIAFVVVLSLGVAALIIGLRRH